MPSSQSSIGPSKSFCLPFKKLRDRKELGEYFYLCPRKKFITGTCWSCDLENEKHNTMNEGQREGFPTRATQERGGSGLRWLEL